MVGSTLWTLVATGPWRALLSKKEQAEEFDHPSKAAKEGREGKGRPRSRRRLPPEFRWLVFGSGWVGLGRVKVGLSFAWVWLGWDGSGQVGLSLSGSGCVC